MLQNPHWISFVGDGTMNIIEFVVDSCRGGDESFQFTVYTNQPFCGPGGVMGLETVAGNCDCITPGDVMTLEFPTIPGQTYYIAMDGCGGAQCVAQFQFLQGGTAPQPDQPEPPMELELPDFEDGPADTVCLGATGVEMEVPYIPFGTTNLLWEFPDGTQIEGAPNQKTLDIPVEYFMDEGPLEICVYAVNDCDTSAPACRDYYVKQIPPVFETATICEGDDFMWDLPDIETEEPGVYNYSVERYSTYGCPYQANLELTVTNENDENPTPIEDVICWGDVYTHPSGYSTAAGANNYTYIWEGVNPGNCDSFFQFNIEVVGGQFVINPPDTCNGNGTISLQSLFLPIGNNVPLSDPDLEVDYSWTLNGQPLNDTTMGIIVDQEMLEDNPFGNYELQVTMDYPGLSSSCSFSTNAFEMRLEDYVPRYDSISGPEFICEGSSATYEVYFQDPENDYFIDNVDTIRWSTPDGVSILDTNGRNVTIQVAPDAEAGDLCVELMTGCGFRDSGCIPLNINSAIVPDLGTGGSPCSYSFTFSPNAADTGQWTTTEQPPNSTASFDDIDHPATTVTVDSIGLYRFVWMEGLPPCQQYDTVEVTFNGTPEITNVLVECNDPPTTYTVSFDISGGTPPYEIVSGSGTISGNQFESSPINSGTNYMIQIEDASGCVTDLIEGVKVCDCETDAGTMDDQTLENCEDECLTATPQNDTVLDGDDLIQYALHEGSGNSLQGVVEIGDSPEFCFQAGMNYGEEYYISRIVGSDDGTGNVDLNDGCLSVALGQPVTWFEQPEADAGQEMRETCGLSLNLAANPSAGQGTWRAISGPGNAIFDVPNNPSTTVSVDEYGIYTFEWMEDNAGCTDADTVSVTFLETPEIQDGSLEITCLQNLDFVITFEITGGSPPYSLVNGEGELNGNTYLDTLSNGSSYDISILDAEDCGPLTLNGEQDCECNSEAGTMASAVLDTCYQNCVEAMHLGGENLEPDDASAYVLHDESGNQLGSVIGMNATGTFCYSDYASQLITGDTYYISFVVGNDNGNGMVDLVDPCLAVAPGQPVVFLDGPQIDAGPDEESCGLEFSTLEVDQSDGAGSWTVLSGPGNAIVDMPSQVQTNVTVDANGLYCFAWTGTYEGCSASDTVCVEFLDAPSVDPANVQFDCNALNTQYTVSFTIEGGEPGTYTVNGDPGSLNQDTFTSDPINSGEDYLFLVSDENECDTFELSGSHMCQCMNQSGSMSQDTVVACPGDSITVPGAQNPVLETGDISRYVLHEGSGTAIEGEISRNDQPTFAFNTDQMNLNQVYYISNIVGNESGNGTIDPDDACIDVSVGTPVIWYSPPNAQIDDDFEEITCEEPVVMLDGSPSTSVTGEGLTVEWTTDNGNIVDGENDFVASVDRPGEYTLIVTDRGSGCIDSSSVMVEVSDDAPLASIEEPGSLTCDQMNVTLDALASSSGTDYSVQWTSNPGGLVEDPSVLDPTVDEAGVYILTVTKLSNGCTSRDSVTVEVDRNEPVAVVEVDSQLSCSRQSVQIDGSGTSAGSDFVYDWSPSDGLNNPDTMSPTAVSEGIYTLVVTDTTNGCSSSASVAVERDTSLIEAGSYTARNPNCDGELTGNIEITDLPGGTPPITYTLNGGTEQNTTGVFNNLGPGNYDIVASGTNGCRYLIDDIELIEPEPINAALPPSIQIERGDEVVLDPTISPSGRPIDRYEWRSTDTLNCDTCASITVTPGETTEYEVTVIDENGCTAITRTVVVVEVNRDVYVPNIFTPNNDGINDVFYLQAKEGQVRNIRSMEIYDRWGNRVFQQENIDPNDEEVGWNGTVDGRRLSPAVFVYVFEVEYFDGLTKQFEGSVTLMR